MYDNLCVLVHIVITLQYDNIRTQFCMMHKNNEPVFSYYYSAIKMWHKKIKNKDQDSRCINSENRSWFLAWLLQTKKLMIF